MRLTVDQYYDSTHFMDLHLISTLGFTDEDVEKIKEDVYKRQGMPRL